MVEFHGDERWRARGGEGERRPAAAEISRGREGGGRPERERASGEGRLGVTQGVDAGVQVAPGHADQRARRRDCEPLGGSGARQHRPRPAEQDAVHGLAHQQGGAVGEEHGGAPSDGHDPSRAGAEPKPRCAHRGQRDLRPRGRRHSQQGEHEQPQESQSRSCAPAAQWLAEAGGGSPITSAGD